MKIKELSIADAFIENQKDILEVDFSKKAFEEYFDKSP